MHYFCSLCLVFCAIVQECYFVKRTPYYRYLVLIKLSFMYQALQKGPDKENRETDLMGSCIL